MTKRFCSILGLLALVTSLAFGQATLTSTTLSSALNSSDTVVNVASATGITGTGSLNQTTTQLVVDKEVMRVRSVSGTSITVVRGGLQVAHASGATVYAGPPNYFAQTDPSGACTATLLPVLPRVVPHTGRVWACLNGTWQQRTTGAIILNGVSSVEGSVLDAALATGVVIVPASPGVTYKVLGATIIPVGGTVATCTDIRVTDSDLSTTDVFRFLVSGTLTAIAYDEASPAAQLTIGGGTAFGTAFAAGKGIGIVSTGSTCGTATSVLYKVTYKASF